MKFQVYPEHCNFYQQDGKLMMHGAELLKLGDRQSAIFCKEFLSETGLVPLTVGVDKCNFWSGPLMGDILEVKVELESLGKHRITVLCEIYNKGAKCFNGKFSFCSFDNNYKLTPHGLTYVRPNAV
jgi:acyl-CoA hydrolase